MSEYTKGPWIFDIDEYDSEAGSYIHVDKQPGPCIAEVVHHETGLALSDVEGCDLTKEQSIANGRLIAAAPELLDAVEYYLNVLDEVNGGNEWRDKPDHVTKKMLLAVTKATQ